MPPHSEVSGDPFGQIDDIRRRRNSARRKRSRSISPGYLRRSTGKHSNRSSRSSSAASEVRGPLPVQPSQCLAVVRSLPSPQRVIVSFHEAPSFLKFNPFIYNGYRTNLCAVTCVKSLFWWTNETLNAWTHLLGWMYFAYFTVDEVIRSMGHGESPNWQDSVMMILILVCFQVCMAMSAGYHTFCCHSHDAYHCWLSYDLCGISFSLLAIYTTGIYYAFWCQNALRTVYIGLSFSLFVVSLIFQTTPKFLTDDYSRARLVFFVSWSTFGVLPCLHWAVQNGFHPTVLDLVSQIGIMYLICGLALFFYVTKIPEVWFPGCVDYVGSSHQWWHIIIFLAFYHWQNAGKYFSAFRAHHGCFEEDVLPFTSSNSTAFTW